MEGISWSTSPHHEAFRRPTAATDTLNRLASFIARAESKSCKPLPQQPLPLQADATLPKLHRCCSCGKEFSLRSSLQLHDCLTQALPPAPPSVPEKPMARLYGCVLCGRRFLLKQALLHHQQAGGCTNAKAKTSPLQRSDDPASPASSEEDFSSSTSLYVLQEARTFRDEATSGRHARGKHSSEQDTDSWESWSGEERSRTSVRFKKDLFSCRSCDMVFGSTDSLSKHRKDTHSRSSKGPAKLDRSRPIIIKVRRTSSHTYTCQVCSQVFFHHLSLWAHKRKHPVNTDTALVPSNTGKDYKLMEKPKSENKPAPCKVLVRESTLKNTLKKYQPKFHKSHKCAATSPEPSSPEHDADDCGEFPCPSCPEVFSQYTELTAHAELHQSAVKRSQCSVCRDEMDSLLKWPSSKRPRLYHCLLCQAGFCRLEVFLTHCQGHLQSKVEQEM